MSNLPDELIRAVREQRSVLFLGAGASRDPAHPGGQQIPNATQMRDLICEKFLGGELKDKPLSVVAALAANEAGLVPFQQYIRDLLLPFKPNKHHLSIPTFRWRAIATTNFDLIVERSYESVDDRVQNLVKIVKDGENFDTRLSKEVSPVGFYKLHGCIDHYTDASIPLVLGTDQYARFDVNRRRFYNRFEDLGHEYPVIFVGYSISDPHIQKILFDLTDQNINRPMFYVINPDISDIESRYWAKNRITTIRLGFSEFLTELDVKIGSIARRIPVTTGGGKLSIRKHYRIADANESEALASYLVTDATHVHSALTAENQDAKDFYRGYDKGWGCILQNLDVKRNFVDSVLVDAVLLDEEERVSGELFMLRGPAGNGKNRIIETSRLGGCR